MEEDVQRTEILDEELRSCGDAKAGGNGQCCTEGRGSTKTATYHGYPWKRMQELWKKKSKSLRSWMKNYRGAEEALKPRGAVEALRLQGIDPRGA